MTSVETRLRDYRDWILKGEFCSLFHDLGKLSSKFIEYRQTWYLSPTGWSDDPHDNCFLRDHEPLAPRFAVLINDFNSANSFPIVGETFSVAQIMTTHAKGFACFTTKYESALNAGDSLDSAHQRNNPLFSGEQTPRSGDLTTDLKHPVFKSNVFGYESDETRLIPLRLDEMRAVLYEELKSHPTWRSWWTGVPDAESRVACLKSVQDAFEFGLGDTTRPVNDTSLWEHTYSVASLTKAIQAAYSIYGDAAFKTKEQWRKPPLMMWGIGWDPIRFIGRGPRLHDLSARREVMRQARDKVRNLIEFDWAIGNTVYEDDGTMVFVIPDWEPGTIAGSSLPSEIEEYKRFIQGLEAKIVELFAGETGYELCPQFAYQPAYRDAAPDLTMVVKLLAKIRTPGSAHVPAAFLEKASDLSDASTDLTDVCPICRIRQIKKSEKAWEREKVCDVCLDRRLQAAQDQRKERGQQSSPETPFLSEISDENGRIAMVVARFGLEDWLNGEMVRTTFVTEADGLERELQLMLLSPTRDKNIEAAEKNALNKIDTRYGLNWDKYDFSRIQAEIEAACLDSAGKFVNDTLAKDTYFLYGRRDFDPLTKLAWPDKDVNRKIAKTPTASRLLNAWRTTEHFFTHWASEPESDGKRGIHRVVDPRERKVYFVESLPGDCREFQAYSGIINGKQIEFTVDRSGKSSVSIIRGAIDAAGSIQEIKTSEGTLIKGEIQVRPDNGKTESFSPFRVVLATPELFLILVPADKALPVIEALSREFEVRFGKVIGRLPFSVGSIFFQEQQPMFVVLDAASRMLRNFAKLQGRHRRSGTAPGAWEVFSVKDGSIEFTNGYLWNLSSKLGHLKEDFYHPYIRVQNCDATRKSYQETPMGNVVHVSDVKAGDIIHPPASDFDFEFLDSSAARFRISLGDKEKRANHVLNDSLTRPIPLEALRADMIDTWKLLGSNGLTESSLRDLLTLLITKLEEWHIELPLKAEGAPGEPAFEWIQLVKQQIAHRLSKLDNDERRLVQKQMMSGIFFETAFLHLHILKQTLENGD